MISLIIRLGNTFEKLLQIFFLNIGTPWNLFKCFLSKNNDSLAKLVCLINLNDADWEALAKIELTSIPFKLTLGLPDCFFADARLTPDFFLTWR